MGDESHSSQDELPLSQESFEYFWQNCISDTNLATIAETQMLSSTIEDNFTNTPEFSNPITSNENVPEVLLDVTPQIQLDYFSENIDPIMSEGGIGQQTYIPTLNDLDIASIQVPVQQIPVPSTSACSLAADSFSESNASVPASLPATSDWDGKYGFIVTFPTLPSSSRKAACTYSALKNKIYVMKDFPCQVGFSTNYEMPSGFIIRALPLFTLPDHSSRVVKRCVSHRLNDSEKGIPNSNHLIQCDSSHSVYEEHPVSKRLSVTVPYENPQRGESSSRYIYKFKCWGSCSGGLNRRPIIVVFTLEHEGNVFGRKSIEVRICACPERDRKSEEGRLHKNMKSDTDAGGLYTTFNSPSKKRNYDHHNSGSSSSLPKRMKPDPDIQTSLPRFIRVKDEKMYVFLMHMKYLYTVGSAMERERHHQMMKS